MVTGTAPAFRTAAPTRRASRRGFTGMALPPPTRVTLRTGHPKFMSTCSTPSSTSARTISPTSRGSVPYTWIEARLLAGPRVRQAPRLGVAVHVAGGRDHLRHEEARAELATEAPERVVRDARHRRQHHRRPNLERSERERRELSRPRHAIRPPRAPGRPPRPAARRPSRRPRRAGPPRRAAAIWRRFSAGSTRPRPAEGLALQEHGLERAPAHDRQGLLDGADRVEAGRRGARCACAPGAAPRSRAPSPRRRTPARAPRAGR